MQASQPLTTRRALMGAVAALPALAAAGVSKASAGPLPTTSDIQLIELGRKHDALTQLADRALDDEELAFERAGDDCPPMPDALLQRPGDQISVGPIRVGEEMNSKTIALLRAAAQDPDRYLVRSDRKAALLSRALEVTAAEDEHKAALQRVRDAHGLTEIQDRSTRLHRERRVLELLILETPATTLEGVRVKAKVVASNLDVEPDGSHEDHLVRRLLADLLAA